jgi:cyclic pyranopterin phosphate synthase
MDVGNSNGWRLDDVVSGSDVIALIDREMPLEPIAANYRGEVAKRWRYRDGSGEVGIITSVTQPFCGDCTRARLSAEGSVYTCLFAVMGTNLRDLIRAGASDDAIEATIREVWGLRDDRYSELRSEATAALPKIEMSYIGG